MNIFHDILHFVFLHLKYKTLLSLFVFFVLVPM